MRFLHFVIYAFFVLVSVPAYAEATQNDEGAVVYFEILHDLPVMPALEPAPEESYSFDKPGGRIISESAYASDIKKERIYDYYYTVLPPLGWRPKGPRLYIRDDERLEISIDTENDFHKVQFFVSPRENR